MNALNGPDCMPPGHGLNSLNQPVEVMRGRHGQDSLFGPLPGVRHAGVVAYEFELPDSFEPWPGRTLLERTFVLLDLGVSFANPSWVRLVKPDGIVVDREREGSGTWYVDLVTVEQRGDRYIIRDLYIDVMVPTHGRHYLCSNCGRSTNRCGGMIERYDPHGLTETSRCRVACAVTLRLPTWPRVWVDKREAGPGHAPHGIRGRGLGGSKRL